MKDDARKPFPFKLDLAGADSYKSQLCTGLREAIRAGYYRSGDLLPSLGAAALALGVSDIVVRGAYRTLAGEGLLVPRKGVGCFVHPPKMPIWRGHVLCVMTDYDFNVRQSGVIGSLRERLTENGFLFSQVLVLKERDGRLNLAGLETALRRPLDFAVLLTPDKDVEGILSAKGLPFAVIGRRPEEALPGCVGSVLDSCARALRMLADKCRARGLRRVEIVCCRRLAAETECLMALLEQRGIDVTAGWVPDRFGVVRTEAAEQTGYAFVRRNLRRRHMTWPDLYYVSDDHVARGMLMAFAEQGVRVPEQVRLVCRTSAGFRPFFGHTSVAAVEDSPYRRGEEIARRILGWLVARRPFPASPIESAFVEGETFP